MPVLSPRLTIKLRWLLPAGLLLLMLPWLLGAAPADDPALCDPAAVCIDARLSAASAVGDFYVDGVLIAAGANGASLTTTPDVPHTVEVRNLQDASVPGYGSLFIYP